MKVVKRNVDRVEINVNPFQDLIKKYNIRDLFFDRDRTVIIFKTEEDAKKAFKEHIENDIIKNQ
jgi:hypothetical protein